MLLCDCGLHYRKIVARGPFAAQKKGGGHAAHPPEENLRIAGTWDFKWTPGTTIRIAVQELPAGEDHVQLEHAIGRLEDALESWVPSKGPGPNIHWQILKERMPAPRGSRLARSDLEQLKKGPFLKYDVLVSFAQLSTMVEATSEHPENLVNYPRCALGTYARRAEYGVPTLYLGPHEGFRGGSEGETLEPEEARKQWSASPEGNFTVIHELGHLFGLAHEQQNPRLVGELAWRTMDEMVHIAAIRNQATLPPGGDAAAKKQAREALELFITAEVRDLWVEGRPFSDWRDPPVVKDGTADFDSVMAKPVYLCFLANQHGCKYECRDKYVCEVEQAEFARLTEPTASDRKQLEAMYGARA